MKNKSIESIYKQLSPREHILARPDTYIGAVTAQTMTTWVCEEDNWKCTKKQVTYVPGFLKCFDEILTNASDHAVREGSGVSFISVDIQSDGSIKVKNDGSGIPVVMHKDAGILLPELIFGGLLSGSNFNDDEDERYGAGRNGYGSKLTNIFSSNFSVLTTDGKHTFDGEWIDSMNALIRSNVSKSKKSENGTTVTFKINSSLFGYDDILTNDHIALIKRRLMDVAAYCSERVGKHFKVLFNGVEVPIHSFDDWIKVFNPDGAYIEKFNNNWYIGATVSSDDIFEVNTIVNGNTCYGGGLHINHIADQVAKGISDKLLKKSKDISIRVSDIKGRLSLFVLCAIPNPTFSTQTKEYCTTPVNKLQDAPIFTDKSIRKLIEQSGISAKMEELVRMKEQKELSKLNFQKYGKPKIEKLEDAIKAGTKESNKCALILTEGDSAKSTAMSGLSIVGKDYYGVYPLRGKVLNVREMKLSKIIGGSEESEISKIITAIGLTPGKKYNTTEALSELRYGSVILFTDQDYDGTHIKSLVINFFHWFFPELLESGFLYEFRTPLVKATNSKEQKSFYSLDEYKAWSNVTNTSSYKIKYYKGLGSSTSEEAKQYFREIEKNLVAITYSPERDKDTIDKAFSKSRAGDRKEWITQFAKYDSGE
jgi:DNA topoisomerase-2